MFLYTEVPMLFGDENKNNIDEELLKIEEIFNANRSIFKNGYCRFVFSQWSADSVEDSLKGIENGQSIKRKIEYEIFMSNGDFIQKTDIDLEAVLKRINQKEISFTPMNIAIKSGFAIDHNAALNNAIVHSPDNYQVNVRYHPFNFSADSSGLDPASAIRYARSKSFDGIECYIGGNAVVDGVDCVILNVCGEKDSHCFTYYIDMSRGCLPLKIEMFNKDKSLYATTNILEIKEIDGGYFPLHSIKTNVLKTDDEKTLVKVSETEVLEIDLLYKPTQKDMALQLPKTTQFYDGINPNSSKTLFLDHENEFVDIPVENIENIYNQLQGIAATREKASLKRSLRNDDIVSKNSGRNWMWIIIIANLFLMVFIFMVVSSRRNRNSEK